MFKKYPILKSLAVAVGFLIILVFLAVRNMENRLQAFYSYRHFKGKVHITGLGLDFQRLSRGLEDCIHIDYVYSEEVDGKRQDIPIEIWQPWASLLLPAYEKEIRRLDEDLYGRSGDSPLSFKETELLDPIVYRAIELSDTKEKEEQYWNWLLKKNPALSLAKIEIRKGLDGDTLDGEEEVERHYYVLETKIDENRKKGQEQLGGAYGLTMRDGIVFQFYQVNILLPDQIDGGRGEDRAAEYLLYLMKERNFPSAAFVFGDKGPTFDKKELFLMERDKEILNER